MVVTRKKVNGRWVKSTAIVHSEPAPTYQLHPDTDRYQQIQQALAAKGFYKGETNGAWGGRFGGCDEALSSQRKFAE